jgi:hypothetical protein
MAPSRTRLIGLEVQKKTIAAADGAQGHGAAGTSLGTLGPRQCAIAQRVYQRPS